MPVVKELLPLTKKLGYSFQNPSLLEEALTHRSVGVVNNERLEFLGDSILNFVIADALFNKYPENNEGDLSRLRASLVNKDSLAEIAADIGLGKFIQLGSGELKSGGHRRASINADAVEGIIGAVFRDSGFDDCRSLILNLFKVKLDVRHDLDALKDPKTRLQELLQSRQYSLPIYTVVEITGKAHEQKFKVECRVDELHCDTFGKERSRRKAEQLAAQKALDILTKQIK